MPYDIILSSTRIGIFSHVNPDGDALGSTLGLGGFLDDLGKEYRIFYPTDPPESLGFMIPDDHKSRICIWGNASEQGKEFINSCDLLIGLDFNKLDRIREWGDCLKSGKAHKILIDHHIAPEREFFDEVYSTEEVSSTCELLFSILKKAPWIGGDVTKLNELCRKSLMTGMTTDSNNFANSVFPGTLAMASELLAAGTDRDSIIQELYFRYPRRRLDAQAFMMGHKMKVTDNGVAYMIMDKETYLRFNLQEGDTEGFVNIPLSLDGVNISVFLKEESEGNKVRVSIRSKKGFSALSLAMARFHGGGHERASGGKLIKGEDIASIEDAEQYILESIKHLQA